jgi:hypothetical protein
MPDATTASCGLPRVELDDDLLADPTHIDHGSLRAGSGRRTRPTRFPLASLHIQRGWRSQGKAQVEQARVTKRNLSHPARIVPPARIANCVDLAVLEGCSLSNAEQREWDVHEP